MIACPHCSLAVPDSAADCPGCGVNFAKWAKKAANPRAALAQPKPELPPFARVAAAAASVFALFFSASFRSYLPIPQGWQDLCGYLLPLSALNVAFHEAGHLIFGILGWRFLMTAGGTLMELAMPAACLIHFAKRKSEAGVLAMLFWLGLVFIDMAYYAADAKMQAIILITGMSGSEGGGHDWGYMLEALGLKNQCVGIGQAFFFIGCWLMSFAPALALARLCRSSAGGKSASRKV